MSSRKQSILNPIGDAFTQEPVQGAPRAPGAKTRGAIGLIDNSKPNVARVLEAFERALRAMGEPEIVTVVKPRSAGPSPDIAVLADRCRFVVNAVGD